MHVAWAWWKGSLDRQVTLQACANVLSSGDAAEQILHFLRAVAEGESLPRGELCFSLHQIEDARPTKSTKQARIDGARTTVRPRRSVSINLTLVACDAFCFNEVTRAPLGPGSPT